MKKKKFSIFMVCVCMCVCVCVVCNGKTPVCVNARTHRERVKYCHAQRRFVFLLFPIYIER